MYDAKRLPAAQQEKTFRDSLDEIVDSVQRAKKFCVFDGYNISESINKIAKDLDELSAGAATEVAEELANLTRIMANRIVEVEILMSLILDRRYVSPTKLGEIAHDERIQQSGNLPERLTMAAHKALQKR